MKISIDKKRLRFYIWVGIAYFVPWFLGSVVNYPGTFIVSALNELWKTAFIIVVNFILFEYTIPFIKLSIKRILIGLLLLGTHLMVYTFGMFVWILIGTQLHIFTPLKTYTSISQGVTLYCCFGIGSFFFFGIIKHIYDYRQLKISTQQLRIEKQQAELHYLKSQTNPHFLFNTLNNIYSLARDKSELAPESILRLSKILRFMLYETSGDYISIEQELKIINDYIALEKLRYDETLRVNFNYDIEDMKQALPPLLLIPLVENAFKHGVSETRSQPFVDIHLSVIKRQLLFLVKNSTESSSEAGRVRENIGLSNLRRQLELLYKEFNLSAQQEDSVYTATLKINLATRV